jgi:hypothetical protein
MSNEILTALLDEGKAHWVDSASMGLLPDKTLVREWRNVPVEHREACMVALRAKRSYTDPKTQTKTHTGVYRVQKVEDIVSKDKEGRIQWCVIRETLAFGLANTLVGEYARLVGKNNLSSTAKNHAISPAHPSGTSIVEQDYQSVTVKWINIDPQSMEAIVAERAAVTAATLTVAGQTITGPFYLLSRKPSWAEDGSGEYEEKWGMAPFVFESYGRKGDMEVSADRLIQNVPKDMVKSVCDAEVKALGVKYGSPGFTYEQRIRWGEDTAEIQTFSVHSAGKDVTRTSIINDDDITVTHTYKNAKSLPSANDPKAFPEHDFVETDGTMKQGYTSEVEGDINSNGDFDFRHRLSKAVKQVVAAFVSGWNYATKESSKSGKNLYDADIAAYDLTQTAGHVKVQRKTINRNGTYDIEYTDEERLDQSIAAPASLTVVGNMAASPTQSSLTAVLDGAANAPAALGTDYGTVSYSQDRYGRYVGTRTITTYNSTFDVPGWVIGSETSTQYVVDFVQKENGGSWYKRTATISLVIGYHATNAAANTAINNGYSYGHFRSYSECLGPRQFKSTKVASISFDYEVVTGL